MQSVKYVRDEDRPGSAVGQKAHRNIDTSPFVGNWITTNVATRGIVKLEITAVEDGLSVHAFGACHPEPCDWGSAKASVFADGIDSTAGLAFCASYDFGFMESDLQAKIKKGVLVVAGFNRFKDDSGRSNYFSREFFYRLD
jgi:hypothetical protein